VCVDCKQHLMTLRLINCSTCEKRKRVSIPTQLTLALVKLQ
jgi:hypothetical protein